jgi:hypothetical protein
METKSNAKMEQTIVTKPVADFSGSSWVTGDAFREDFSTFGSVDGDGASDVVLNGKTEHFFTSSDIWVLSQPKKKDCR